MRERAWHWESHLSGLDADLRSSVGQGWAPRTSAVTSIILFEKQIMGIHQSPQHGVSH